MPDALPKMIAVHWTAMTPTRLKQPRPLTSIRMTDDNQAQAHLFHDRDVVSSSEF